MLGDGRWRILLDNHDTIVRHEIDRFGGREVNTAGDGFVATYTSPSAAIACADAIVDAVRVLGIQVRAGIHAGEVEVRGALKEDVAGMAVHIGARVAALRGAQRGAGVVDGARIVTGSTTLVRRSRRAPLERRSGPLAAGAPLCESSRPSSSSEPYARRHATATEPVH